MYVNVEIIHKLPYAGSGKAPPCTRNFFEKKLSKSFPTAAAGNGCGYSRMYALPRPPKGRRTGWAAFSLSYIHDFKAFSEPMTPPYLERRGGVNKEEKMIIAIRFFPRLLPVRESLFHGFPHVSRAPAHRDTIFFRLHGSVSQF